MQLVSPAFKNNEFIPAKYTCDGDDINPPLIFEGVPDDAASLALIISDPDAPQGTFIHWAVFDIDPGVRLIEEDSIPKGVLATNHFQRLEYGGPCPSSGVHHYIFRLYALDDLLGLEEGVPAREVEDSMEGVILDSAELIGLYGRAEELVT